MSKTSNAEERAADRIATDDRFRLLAAERRRIVLDVLEGWNPPVELHELATEVARWEGEDEAGGRVALTLHHRHLPMMADVGALDYDPEEKTVTACWTTLDQLLR